MNSKESFSLQRQTLQIVVQQMVADKQNTAQYTTPFTASMLWGIYAIIPALQVFCCDISYLSFMVSTSELQWYKGSAAKLLG